ncbi:MAG: penicillin-binding protein 2 [Patescibacteria group bacterium]|nr:penicillin-binding protein 2 [Patescibacteria group bacterium]
MKAKIYLVFVFFVVLSGWIVFNLYCLQIQKGDYYKALALGQQISFGSDSAGRGNIFFSDGKTVLASTRGKIIAYVFPNKITGDFASSVDTIADILGEGKAEFSDLLKKGDVIKREISVEQQQEIQKQKIDFVQSQETTVRLYPQGALGANVLGFVNEEGQGQYGVEAFYDKTLKPESTTILSPKGPFGKLVSFLEFEGKSQKSSSGASLWLSLDKNLQYAAEKLLAKGKTDFDFDSAQIIVEEPSSGRILVLAVWPGFNANEYGQTKDLSVFLNPAVQSIFEPGSVFKPFTMAAGLEEKLVTPETEYVDTGSVSLGGPLILNFEQRTFGEQTMADVLEKSINTGAVFVEQKLGGSLFLKYLDSFGFFSKTGIDLSGEVASTNSTLKHGYPRDFASAAFGQGIEITPIQMVQAFGALANKGKMMKPFIVDKIVQANGKETITQPVMERQVISGDTAAALAYMLSRVVCNGSGIRTKITGYAIAGKTGTAQVAGTSGGYQQGKTTQSFIGFFPAESPRALILVKLDNPKGVSQASRCAVPMAKEMIKYILDLWQIPPSGYEVLPWPGQLTQPVANH